MAEEDDTSSGSREKESENVIADALLRENQETIEKLRRMVKDREAKRGSLR